MLSYMPAAIGEPAVLDTFERTSSNEVSALVDALRNAYEASRHQSRFRELLDRLEVHNSTLNQLCFVSDNWNGYGSPAPSKESIEAARGIMNSLWSESLVADKVLPSADGGVSLIFLSDSDNRAVIEHLNEGETYVLLYDRQGNSKTLIWGGTLKDRADTLRQLHTHLQGTRLAVA